MKNKKDNKNLIYAILIGVALITGVILVRQKMNSLPNTQTSNQTYQQIENNTDLSQASSDLDKEMIESLDEGLSQNDSDTFSF